MISAALEILSCEMNNKEITMKKKVIMIMLLAGIMFTLSGCADNKNKPDNNTSIENSGKLKVITTMFAPYDFVRQIAGDNVDVTMLLAPGEESHSYDPTPQDIISIQNSDLFIYNGGENESWVDNVLSSLDDVNVISMTKSVDKLYEEELTEGMQAEPEETTDDNSDLSEKEEYDEHVWASPANAIKIIRTVTDELKKLDTDNASVYEDNCTKYSAEIQKIDDDFKSVVAAAKRKVVVFGDRFPLRYFVEEYGLDYFAAFPGCSADTEADSSTIAFLIDKVKAENIPVVFKIELSNGNIADTISEATGTKVETFYACHNISSDDFKAGLTYADMMKSNVNVLKEALN